MPKVYLAVGHGRKDSGGYDPGARSEDGLWTEQSAGNYIVHEIAQQLRAYGVDVMHEAFQDDPNYKGTVRRANSWKADRLVAIHHDWSGAPVGAFGFWVSDAGKTVADAIHAQVKAAGFPTRDSWHKKRDNLYVLNESAMPAVLYECGRIGQPTLDTEFELRTLGRAIAEGIANELGLRKKDDMAVASWAQEAWDWAGEEGIRTEHTKPNDPVDNQTFFVFMYRYNRKADKVGSGGGVNEERVKALEDAHNAHRHDEGVTGVPSHRV